MKTLSLMLLVSVTFSVMAEDTTRDMVKKLGDTKFATREKTQETLHKKMDFDVFFGLLAIYKEEGNQEIRLRLSRLIEGYYGEIRAKYAVDLKGYKAFPFIDEGMPENYNLDKGKWKGWSKKIFIAIYLEKTQNPDISISERGYPSYQEYRIATRLWMQERIDYDLGEAIKGYKSKKDFEDKMKEGMEAIQKDIEILIEGDRKFYKKQGMKNPFERDANLIKMP